MDGFVSCRSGARIPTSEVLRKGLPGGFLRVVGVGGGLVDAVFILEVGYGWGGGLQCLGILLGIGFATEGPVGDFD